jgi:YtkA-like
MACMPLLRLLFECPGTYCWLHRDIAKEHAMLNLDSSSARGGYAALVLLSAFVLASVVACMAATPEVDTSSTRLTLHNKYRVALRPLTPPVDVNKMHAWEIQLTSPAGEPVSRAQIAVDGGMPQHRHGLPTQPRVTQELGDGRYLLEGMKFSMSGWWEIRLSIRSEAGTDDVTFNTIVAPAVAGS